MSSGPPRLGFQYKGDLPQRDRGQEVRVKHRIYRTREKGKGKKGEEAEIIVQGVGDNK